MQAQCFGRAEVPVDVGKGAGKGKAAGKGKGAGKGAAAAADEGAADATRAAARETARVQAATTKQRKVDVADLTNDHKQTLTKLKSEHKV